MRTHVTSFVVSLSLVACSSSEGSREAAANASDASVAGASAQDASSRMDAGQEADGVPTPGDTPESRASRAPLAGRSGSEEMAKPREERPAAPAAREQAGPSAPGDMASRRMDAGTAPARPATDDDASVDDDAGTIMCDAPNLDGLGLATVVTGQGLETLSYATQAPDSADWYLVEQRGRILILRDGALLPEPFLDLQSEIVIGEGYEDRGLLSLAFAPDFVTSGLVYVVFTPTLGLDANRDLVLEYRRSDADPDRLDPESRTKIVELIGSVSNNYLRNIHNGGRALFGPDGFLYVAMGDGGGVSCNDVETDEPQDPGSSFGKILRLDPRADPPHAARGNPFARGGDPRVYHYGLRNPYSYSFDRRTGDLYIGDVGQNSYEEVDFAPAGSAGLNFGWAAFEGVTKTCPDRPQRARSTHTEPIFVADRRARGCSGDFCDWRAVVGGAVYRGASLPQLDGVYLFGDYAGRRMVGIRRCGASSSELRTIRKRCDVGFADELCFQALEGTPDFSGLTGIVEGNDGELYLIANRDSLLKVTSAPIP